MRPFDVITFDCYGPLIDWETGIAEAFHDAAAPDGVNLDPAAVLQALFDTRPAAEAPEYRSYREILTDAAARVGERLGWRISRERAEFLPESLPHWKPFPDTNDALTRLTQQVRSYKPAPGHFKIARDRVGTQRWLHAAQSYFHDVAPAIAHRIPVAWINRKGEQPTGAGRPDWEFRTLTELADSLT